VAVVLRLSLSYKGQDDKVHKRIANLLVVDDDSDIAHVIKQGLIKNRFLVSVFTSPGEALQNFQSNSKDYYCLMLSDIECPALFGIQLARKSRRIILISR
jgi:DNA-binding response OmpR family regulator